MPEPVSLGRIIQEISSVIEALEALGDLGYPGNARRANVIYTLEAISHMVEDVCETEDGVTAPSFVPVWARGNLSAT